MNDGPTKVRAAGSRSFYVWTAFAIALIVFMGFSRTYYLKSFFGTEPLPLLLHIHGIVMTLWFALFLVQVCLVAAHRTDLHRKLGVIGAVLAVLVVVLGTRVIIVRDRLHFSPGRSVAGLAFQLTIFLVFAGLVASALIFRRRGDVHKRLMLLACISILLPAIVRLPFEFIKGNILIGFALIDLCVLLPVIIDTVKNRRLHWAFGWGALLIIVSEPLSLVLGTTRAWTGIGNWLMS